MIVRERQNTQPERTPTWLVLLAYFAYLRAMRPQQPPEIKTLRWLILAFIVMALVSAGAPEKVVEVIRHWSIIP
jgi:hypothetical protein